MISFFKRLFCKHEWTLHEEYKTNYSACLNWKIFYCDKCQSFKKIGISYFN